MNLKKEADLIEEQGRYGDTELVHLNPMEVKWLEKMTPGGKLTRNPVTGKKEAWVQYVIMAVSAIANIAAGKKRQKEAEKAAQEGAYIEGSAPIIPASNQLELETIGEAAPEAGGLAPDFREALQDSYGGGMYDSPQFQGEQIPPELMELMQQQQMSGQEPTNVQFANSGGPVGLPEDVYNFPVEKISQMQMDVDPGVRNVGNAMMAQMEANPGMGMVGASAADIDQMAAGGPVRPKKYQDGSEGGLRGYLSMDEMPEDATDYDKRMQLELIANERQRNAANSDGFITSSARGFIEDPKTGELIPELLPTPKYYDSPLEEEPRSKVSPERIEEILEMVKLQNRALSDRDREMLGLPMATGGPVQPRRYQDGSEGGLDIFAMLDQRAEDEGRLTGGDMEREYLFESMNAPSVEKLTKEELRREQQIDYLEANVDGIKDFELDKLRREWEEEKRRKEALPDTPPQAIGMSREAMETILEKQGRGAKALHGIEQVLGRIMPRQGYSEKRSYDEGPLIQEQGLGFRSAPEERAPFAQYKIFEERFGPEESRLEKLLERIGDLDGERVKSLFKRKERPSFGPQMRNDGGSVRPKKYQDGDQVKGTDQSLRELKQMAKSRGISRIEELLGFRLPEGLGEQDIEDVLLNAGLGELGIPITKRGDNYSYARRLGEDSNINVSVNPDQKAVQLGFEKRFNTGGPVQPRRYQEGSEGGIRELYKKIPTNLRLLGEYLAGAESPITEKDFTTEELDVIRNQIVAQKINNEALEDEYRKAGNADAVETFETTRGRTSVSPYDIQESGLPTTKTTFGRSYLSGGSGAVDKGWEESLKSLNDPSYTVATSLGKYTAEDIDDGFRIRENYDFNKGSLERPSPIQDIESLDQLKNLLATMQATPEVVGETLANMIRSEPRAVDIRL